MGVRATLLLPMLLLGGCGLLPHRLDAPPQPPPATPQPAAAEVPDPCASLGERNLIDDTKRRLQETVCQTALWFDGFFGERDVRDISAARESSGRAELSTAYSQFTGTKVGLRFNAHMTLPNLRHRLSVFVGRDSEDSFVRDRSESYALRTRFPHLEDHDETIAGLGYALPESYRFKSEFRTGVRFAGLTVPKAFAQFRFAYNAYADDLNLVDLRTTPFINTRDGLGLTTTLDYSRVLGDSRLFRWSNIATVTQKAWDSGVDWRSAAIIYQGLTGKRAVALETFVRGDTGAPVPLAEYGSQVIYRQPLAHERLYGEAVTGYSWPKTDPNAQRKGSYAVALILELPFGEP
ncbi:MAG TPA: hypothetical protein VHE37_00115 [Nevskiaceae bacterium]|nr:hypothetical protein [Nevskiaceae bacterium]